MGKLTGVTCPLAHLYWNNYDPQGLHCRGNHGRSGYGGHSRLSPEFT